MNKYLLTLGLAVVLTGAVVTSVSAEDATRSATRKAAQEAISQAKLATRTADQLTKFKTAADKFIDERTTSLNKQISRIKDSKKLTADDKTLLAGDLNTAIAGLTALRAKVDAETATAPAKDDIKSVFSDFKVYAVLEPKIEGLMMVAKFNFEITRIEASAAKINNLIAKAKTAGKDTTQMATLYTDYQTKIADAKTQVVAARAKFTAMKITDPDSAKTLFLDGKTLLKAAKADLIAAHKDLQAIIPLLRSALGVKTASESATPATKSGTASSSAHQ